MLDVDQLIPHNKNRQIKDIRQAGRGYQDRRRRETASAGSGKKKTVIRFWRDIAGPAAAKLLLSQGEEQYRQLPCIVESDLDEDEQEILLIVLNEQQEKSDYEKMQDAVRLKELISRKKKAEHLPGSVRQHTAEALGETQTQIARYEAIDKNLCPELKEELKDGKLGISAAYEASRLEPEKQQKIMQQPERTIKAMKSLSNSDKLDKKQQEEQLKEDFAAYICDELCKHTMKKEANLIKQCERCRVDEFMKELKRK